MLAQATRMNLKLSTVSLLVGLLYAAPQVFGLVRPAQFTEAARRFPRSMRWGWTLMLLGTVWFLFNLSEESIADFAAYKNFLLVGFAGVGIGSCIFVQDFLGARGLAVTLLLLAKTMVDSGRPALPYTSWALCIQIWAYIFVIAGIWLTISPWRLRDWINWLTANPARLKLVCGANLGLALLVCALGLTKF